MSARFRRQLQCRAIALVGAGFAVLLIQTPAALSAELSADLTAYCAATFGAGAEGGIDRRDNRPICTERTDGGLGLLHHKIDAATVCQTQHGTDRFRQEGGGLVCLTGDGGESGPKTHDLAEYCRRNYGDDAIVSQRLTDGQPLCTVKGDGGLSQTHHAIDTRALCGGDAGSVSGDTLDCGKSATASDARPNAGGSADGVGERRDTEDRAGRDNGPAGEVPETAYVRHADEPDLSDCGLAPGIELVELGYPFPLADGNWENGSAPTPCAGLAGGFKPDLDGYCRDHFGGARAGILPDGRPICHPPDYFPTGPEAGGYWMILSAVCSAMYPQSDDLRRGSVAADGAITTEGSLYPVVKYTGGALECFYLDVTAPEFELRLMEAAHGDVREVKDQVEFFGGPFHYDVVYQTRPDDPVKAVTIEASQDGDPELELSVSPAEGSDLIFRSEPFYIAAPADPLDDRLPDGVPSVEAGSDPQWETEDENGGDISYSPSGGQGADEQR